MDSEMLKITRLGRRDTWKILKKTRIVLRGLIESFEDFLCIFQVLIYVYKISSNDRDGSKAFIKIMRKITLGKGEKLIKVLL